MRSAWTALAFTLLACGSSKPNPFTPRAECVGATVTPLMGDRQLVLSSLAIAPANVGFDLLNDGVIRNKMSPLGGIANGQIASDFKRNHSIVVPFELFGYMGETTTMCTKLAFYVGRVNLDRDGDGADTNWNLGKSDCLDTDPTVHPGVSPASETVSRLDLDCSGKAGDVPPGSTPTDMQDLDGDGFSPAQGDCDDRNDAAHLALAKSRHPGAKDICDDGIDQDCNGIADDDPSCDPFAQNNEIVYTTKVSFDPTTMAALVTFKDGTVTPGMVMTGIPNVVSPGTAAGIFNAGPDLFNFAAPFKGGQPVQLAISGARLRMALVDDPVKKLTTATDGLLGGVVEAVTLAQVTGLDISGFIAKDQSLLDGLWLSGLAQSVLGLDTDKDGHLLPDIDVDGDGIETFWQQDPTPTGQSPHIDTCKDGDGTIIRSMPGAPCALAKDAKGNYRFVDGLSIAIQFTAVPARISSMVLAK